MQAEPGPAFATVEDAIAAEVAEVEAELRRIDSRLATLTWGGGYARPRRGNESWSDVSFKTAAARDDDGGDLPRQVLRAKREALLLELGRLRQRLVGQGEFAELAKAQLRMIRAEAGAVTAYGRRQDAVVGDGTVNPAPDEPTRSTGLQGAVALVDRIDQLVGRYA